ncbi:hypothetical protein [Jatrophihabitans fulvus]
MIIRRGAVPVAALLVTALLVTGCTATVDGTGRTGSRVVTSGVPVPCGSTGASRAPACVPSPSPSSSRSLLAARWAQFVRDVYDTALGDPAVLNVCKVVLSADVARYGVALERPADTLAASCSLELKGSGVTDDPSMVVSVLRSGPDTSPTPRRTTVSGQTVYAFPYQRDGACVRSLVSRSGGTTTTVSVRLYGTLRGGRATSCGVSDAVIAPFAALAAGEGAPPALPTGPSSLLSLDACKVASAAGFGASTLAAGATARPTDYDTSCSYSDRASLFVSAGVLRDPSATPEGRAVTVAGHRLYDTSTTDGTCKYTSKQAGGETLEVYYSGARDATAAQCRQAAGLLGRYLDVLGLR